MTIRVLLVDDHAVVRQGLRMFLSLDEQLDIVGEAVNGADALQKAHVLQPDVILMDLMMPVMDGITAIGILRRDLPDIEIIALTSVLEDTAVFNAMRAGATGYLLKDTEAEELCRAIKAAAAGQVQLSPQAAARLLREVPAPDSPEQLTDRETDVLRLVAPTSAQRVHLFYRYEWIDLQNEVPDGFDANPAGTYDQHTVGVAWFPIDQVVAKLDFQTREDDAGERRERINAAIGFSF